MFACPFVGLVGTGGQKPSEGRKNDGAAEKLGCADAAFATLCLCLSLSVCTTKSFLFEVLKHPSVLRDRVPVLIACNKSERMNAFSPEFVKKRLEKEIEVLLSTQGDLSDTVGGAEGNANIASTKEGQAFKLSDCYSKVTAAAVSASKGTIKPIRQFITS